MFSPWYFDTFIYFKPPPNFWFCPSTHSIIIIRNWQFSQTTKRNLRICRREIELEYQRTVENKNFAEKEPIQCTEAQAMKRAHQNWHSIYQIRSQLTNNMVNQAKCYYYYYYVLLCTMWVCEVECILSNNNYIGLRFGNNKIYVLHKYVTKGCMLSNYNAQFFPIGFFSCYTTWE